MDYVVKDGEVMIVDEFTGRLMPGRRWCDGLHQAIEAKEGVKIENENQTLATITFQNYFRMYEKLAGMTGTADTEAAEFHKIYKLDVVVIPTNRPHAPPRLPRCDLQDREGEVQARLPKRSRSSTRRGSRCWSAPSPSRSRRCFPSSCNGEGIPHNVLNAKHHEKEAEIVAQAGRKGMVTIATNMAGRGTDIVLGGNPEGLASRCARAIPSYPRKSTKRCWQNPTASCARRT